MNNRKPFFPEVKKEVFYAITQSSKSTNFLPPVLPPPPKRAAAFHLFSLNINLQLKFCEKSNVFLDFMRNFDIISYVFCKKMKNEKSVLL